MLGLGRRTWQRTCALAAVVVTTIVSLGLVAPPPALAFKAGAHWALALKVEAQLPDSRIKRAMIAEPDCLAWGTNGPDLAGCLPGMGLERVPWFDAYHYQAVGAYARRLMQDALASNDNRQIAFAAGWITHMEGDMAVHGLLVNPEAGVYIDGDSIRNSDGSTTNGMRDLHCELEGWADPVVWADIAHLPIENYTPAGSSPNEADKLYRKFVSSQGFGTLTVPSDNVLENLVDKVNHEVILDPSQPLGGYSHLENTGGFDVSAFGIRQQGDYFGPDNMRTAYKVMGEVLSADWMSARTGLSGLVDLLREGKIKLYQPLATSRTELEKKGWQYGSIHFIDSTRPGLGVTGTDLAQTRMQRLQAAWDQSLADSVILLDSARHGDYSQFSDTWVMDQGIDGRQVGSLSVTVKTGRPYTTWYGIPDGPGTNHYVYFGMQYDNGQKREWKLEQAAYDDFEKLDRDVYYLHNPEDMPPWRVKKIWMRLGSDQYGPDLPMWDLATFSVQVNNKTIYSCAEWNHWMESGTDARTTEWTTSAGHLNPMSEVGWPTVQTAGFEPVVRPSPLRAELYNGAFEWDRDSWQYEITGRGTFEIHDSSDTHVYGARGVSTAYISCDEASPAQYAELSQKIRVLPNHAYRASAWSAKGYMTDTPPDMIFDFLDSANRVVQTNTVHGSQFGITKLFMKQMSISATSPANAASCIIHLRALGEPGFFSQGAAAYFDDVRTFSDTVSNASFENFSAGMPDNWDWSGTAGTWSKRTDWKTGGESSLGLSNPSTSTTALARTYQMLRVTPGKMYRASVMAMTTCLPSDVQVWLEYRDAQDRLLTRTVASGDQWGLSGTEMRPISVAALAPPTADTGCIQLVLGNAGLRAGRPAGSAVFDEVVYGQVEPTTLSMTVPNATAVYSLPTSIRVTLANSLTNKPIVEKPVVLERLQGTAWMHITSVWLPDGTCDFTLVPTAAGTYRARFLGDEKTQPVVTSARTLKMIANLTAPSAPGRVKRNKAFTVSAYLMPRHALHSKAVQLRCYRLQKKKWVLRKTVWLRATNYSTYSKCAASVKLPYKGSWRLQAYHPRDGAFSSSTSTVKKLTVR